MVPTVSLFSLLTELPTIFDEYRRRTERVQVTSGKSCSGKLNAIALHDMKYPNRWTNVSAQASVLQSLQSSQTMRVKVVFLAPAA